MSVLEDFNNAHPIVSDIFNWLILAARRGHRISFCWVPAHVSVKGNEKANEVAKTGTSRQVTVYPVPHRDLFPTIRAAVHVVWQERWNANRATFKMGAITARDLSSWSYAETAAVRRHWPVYGWAITASPTVSSCPEKLSPTVMTA